MWLTQYIYSYIIYNIKNTISDNVDISSAVQAITTKV